MPLMSETGVERVMLMKGSIYEKVLSDNEVALTRNADNGIPERLVEKQDSVP